MDASDSRVATVSQSSDKFVDSSLGFTEDENLASFFKTLEVFLEMGEFVVVLNKIKTLDDSLVCSEVSIADHDLNWILTTIKSCKFFDFCWPGCTPHESLTIWSHLSENLLDISFKSHVLKFKKVYLTSILSASSSTR